GSRRTRIWLTLASFCASQLANPQRCPLPPPNPYRCLARLRRLLLHLKSNTRHLPRPLLTRSTSRSPHPDAPPRRPQESSHACPTYIQSTVLCLHSHRLIARGEWLQKGRSRPQCPRRASRLSDDRCS